MKVTEDGARKRGRRIAPEPMGVFQIDDPEKGWAYAWRHGEVAAWEAESWGATRRRRRSGEAAVEIMAVVCRFERNRVVKIGESSSSSYASVLTSGAARLEATRQLTMNATYMWKRRNEV